MRHTGGTLSQADANKAFYRSLRANERAKEGGKKSVLTWAIINRETEVLIGTQALSWQKTKQEAKPSTQVIEQVEIGINLAPSANGKNFPEESVAALMEYGFKYLSLNRINAFYAKKNLATKRILKKLGYIFEPDVQDYTTHNSYQYFDSGDWQKNIITKIY
jgi:RimJ/RimL family protein N-acetyltransferase